MTDRGVANFIKFNRAATALIRKRCFCAPRLRAINTPVEICVSHEHFGKKYEWMLARASLPAGDTPRI
jgi:hypothetical protein